MKKIILLACDPGGANTVAPLLNTLKLAGYDVALFGKNSALMRYKVIGENGQDLSSLLEKFDFEDVLNFIKLQKPDLVVTGTSAEDFTEKNTWVACKQLNIPCFAILDQWINYGVRFSKYKLSELALYQKNRDHSFLPTKIFVMDEFAKQKTIQEGIASGKIVVTGQPYFDWLSSNVSIEARESGNAVKTVLFVSEPISQNYGDYLGYTEKTIFNELTSALHDVTLKNRIKITVLIKPHPRENLDYFVNLVENNKNENLSLKVVQQSNFLDLINQADIICGMSSMALLEAVILKKNVISIQIGLKQESPFILDILGTLKSVRSRRDLALGLEPAFVDKNHVKCDFGFVPNAIQNIIAQIEEIFHGDEQNKKNKCINKNNASSCN